MKRIAPVGMIALSVALSACATGTDIGKGLTDPGTSINSPSPGPSIKVPKKNSKPGKKDEPKKVEEKKVNTIIIAVRNNNDGFEYQLPGKKEWVGAHSGGPATYVDDIIIFKNLDTEGCKANFFHSWVNEKTGTIKEGKLFNSGKLKCGQEFRWTVPNKPGRYMYKDGEVPYRQGGWGPLVICSSPACPEASG